MAYKANVTSKQLNILLKEDTEEARELKGLILELVQFSTILNKDISERRVRKVADLNKKWNLPSESYPQSMEDFQMLQKKADFNLMGFINYEAYVLSALDFFDIQDDVRRNVRTIYEILSRNKT